MARLKSAGFEYIKFGLESGSERVRREVLKRPPYTNQEFLDFCALAREHGIIYDLYTMMGLPGETREEWLETVEIVRAANPRNLVHGIFYPYPGTELYGRVREMGLIPDGLDPSVERQKAVLDLPGFPRRQIQREYRLFPYRVYRGHKSPLRIAALTARVFIGGSPRLNSLYRQALRNPLMQSLKKRLSNI
jgi:hypothetical protein